jgi:hypothetical protein
MIRFDDGVSIGGGNLPHFDLGLVRHFLPDRNILFDETGESFRRAADDLHRLALQKRPGFRVFQRLQNFCVELGDDRGGRIGRRQNAVPTRYRPFRRFRGLRPKDAGRNREAAGCAVGDFDLILPRLLRLQMEPAAQ